RSIGNYSTAQYLDLNNMYGIGGQLVAAGATTSFGNEQLQWETTTTTNIGLDLSLIQNQLVVNADVFNRVTENILYRLPVPPSFGIVSPALQNIASVSNKGWEFNIRYRSRIGKVSFNTGLNVSYVKNRIESLNTREAVDDKFILREGQAINSFFGYVVDGIFRDSTDLANYPVFAQTGRKIGAMRFR